VNWFKKVENEFLIHFEVALASAQADDLTKQQMKDYFFMHLWRHLAILERMGMFDIQEFMRRLPNEEWDTTDNYYDQ